MKLTVEETFIYLYNKIFNDEVFEVFPKLKECYEDDPIVLDNLFADFIEELYDLSKPVVRPFLDERYTYAYRKTYGILDDGELQSKVSVGRTLNLTGSRINQFIKYNERLLVNMLINEYHDILDNVLSSKVSIEDLRLSNRVYNQLKRIGINYVSDINIDSLSNMSGFGEKTISEIEKGLVRVKK